LPCYWSYQMIFYFSELVSFLHIFHVVQCTFLIFHNFLPYSMSYNLCVSFSTFFNFLALI
jgi:hypothetical protein